MSVYSILFVYNRGQDIIYSLFFKTKSKYKRFYYFTEKKYNVKSLDETERVVWEIFQRGHEFKALFLPFSIDRCTRTNEKRGPTGSSNQTMPVVRGGPSGPLCRVLGLIGNQKKKHKFS